MRLPTVAFRVAFSTNPTAAPTWTDISASYARAFSTKRGRALEWDRMQAGTATVLLRNQDRRFDPTYSAGPYYGNLLPLRRANLRATWNGITYDVFSGVVLGWPQEWQANGRVAVVPLDLADGFHVLSLAKLNATYIQQSSGARINEVLDDALWTTGQGWQLADATYGLLGSTTYLAPVGARSVEAGNSTVQASALANTVALEHLRLVEDTENGVFFVGKDGAAVFQSRHRRLRPPYTSSQYTWGDGGGSELPYQDLELNYDETQIENDVRLARVGGAEQVASDATSQNRYFLRTYSHSGLLQTTDAEVASAAGWRLNRRKEPAVRVVSMTVNPARDPDTLWPIVLGAEIGDRWTVRRRPPGGGSAISQESFVEGIEHRADPSKGWAVTFRLSPADTATYWQLGTATLGVDTRLVY